MLYFNVFFSLFFIHFTFFTRIYTGTIYGDGEPAVIDGKSNYFILEIRKSNNNLKTTNAFYQRCVLKEVNCGPALKNNF